MEWIEPATIVSAIAAAVIFLMRDLKLVSRVWDWFLNCHRARRLEFEIQVNDPSHMSRIRILNSGKQPLILHATDWCIGRRRNRRCFDSATWDQEILPENTFDRTFSPYGVFSDNVWRFSRGKDLHTLRFRAHTSTGNVRIFPPDKRLVDCLAKQYRGRVPQAPESGFHLGQKSD